MMRARCPTCHKSVEADPEKRSGDYPFCSERCRLLDLHKWLSGDYKIPVTTPQPLNEEEVPE
ncbi:MAG: DNA gyrase inhibitor YacG [Planctomycetota bacterium]|jgi:endogenous inhibitor of DNA gyrase (YacG/DUF329 family)